jgi:redox-sensitive bicupin YhaK (pirin superfamily)
MIELRKANQRGHASHGWLESWHTFSFAEYYDPQQMGYSALRVINDDYVQPGQGFGMHGHSNMEIVTYVLEGALQHKDSLGNGSVIRPGDVQRMSAGSGIRHSEFNPSAEDRVHLLQIWLLPAQTGLPPGYEQKFFADDEKRGRFRLIASPDGADGSVHIGLDCRIFAALLDGSELATHTFSPGRTGYLHVARGTLEMNGLRLQAGDGVKIADENKIALSDGLQAEVLLFDLPNI